MGKRAMSCIWTPGLQSDDGHCCIVAFSDKDTAHRWRPGTTPLPAASQEPQPLLLTGFALGNDDFLLTAGPQQWLWPRDSLGERAAPSPKAEAVFTGAWKGKVLPSASLCFKSHPAVCGRGDPITTFTLQATPTWGLWEKTASSDQNLTSDSFASLAPQHIPLWMAQSSWLARNLQWSHKITYNSHSSSYSPSCSGSVEARSSKTIRGVYFKACRQHVLITKQGHYAILLS